MKLNIKKEKNIMTTEDINAVNKSTYVDTELLKFLRASIETSSDGMIRCTIEDIKKQMNINTDETPTSIYWSLKRMLFDEGFSVAAGETIDYKPVLIIRKKVEGDKLPSENLVINNDSKILISMSIDGEDIFQEVGITKEHAISLLEEIGYGGVGNEKYKIDEVSIFMP
jgi:hypothetical protein